MKTKEDLLIRLIGMVADKTSDSQALAFAAICIFIGIAGNIALH